MKSILTILFVVATAISIFAQGQIVQPVDGQLYEGWQIKEYFIRHNAPQNARLIDASKIYKFNKYKGNNGEFTPHCVDCPPSKTETVYQDRIEYRDRDRIVYQDKGLTEEFFLEVTDRMAAAYKDAYKNSGNNGSSGGGSGYSQLEYQRDMRMIELAEKQVKQNGWAVGAQWFSGLSQAAIGITNNILTKRGYYQSNIYQNLHTYIQQGGSGGTFTPDDRLPVGVGGGNNNSALDPFYPNFSGQNGTSGTSFSNNNSSSNQGFIPGDNNTVGGRYVYRQSR